ncbi:MAG: AraC family transcriptional regulator [Pseudomonadota bacterium]
MPRAPTSTMTAGVRSGGNADRLLTLGDFEGADQDPFLDDYHLSLPSDVAPSKDLPLFSGHHESRHLALGPKLEISALTAMCDSHHAGVLKRSLTLLLPIDCGPLTLAVGGGENVVLERGQALLIAMREPGRFASINRRGDRFRSLLLQTRPEDLADGELADLIETATASNTLARLPASSWSAALAATTVAADPTDRLIEDSCAMGLLAQGLQTVIGGERCTSQRVTAGDRKRMMLVRDILIASPDKQHCLADLAREAGVSVTTLTTKFAAVFGVSVFGCLRDIRLEQARAGMEQDGWTVSQAAYTVGYRHLGSFSEAFRQKFGLLPSDFRRRIAIRSLP